MDELSHEFILPHEGPELANMRAPSPAVDPPDDMQAQVEDAEDNNDQPCSHTRYSEAYPMKCGQQTGGGSHK